MEHKILDDAFLFNLEQLDEVTLRKVGCSHAHELGWHVDSLKGWVEGLDSELVERFRAHLHGDCCCFIIWYDFSSLSSLY